MDRVPRWLKSAWRTLTRGRALDRELHDELQSYVDLETDESIRQGVDRSEARRQSLVRMGGLPQVEELVRARRRAAWLAQAAQDARYALRTLLRAPAFAISTTLTLALAIGATATMFTTVRTVVISPLPYPESDSLVQLTGHGYVGEYLQYRERSRTMDVGMFASVAPMTLTGRGEPARLETVTITSDLFDVLGTAPSSGRGPRAGDGVPGAERSVYLSDRIWRERLAADASIIGSTLTLDGIEHRVAGVMPHGFAFPDASVDLWTPLIVNPADRIGIWSRGGAMLGRLRPDADIEAARAEVAAMAPGFRAMFPWRMPDDYGRDASVVRLKDLVIGGTDSVLLAAFGAVAFVMIIACLNVGVLLLGRSMTRRHEMLTRAAIGATSARLARQSLVECGVLAALGGALALAVGAFATSALATWLPADLARLNEVTPDRWLVLAVVVLTAAAGLVVAAVPTWRAARPGGSLAAGHRVAGHDRAARIATRALVAAEVALAVVLVFGAGLLVRSLDRLFAVDPGFEPAGVLTATIAPPEIVNRELPGRRAFHVEAVQRLEALPGVRAAAVTDRLPFNSLPWGSVFSIDGRPDPASESGDWPWADYRAVVSPAYFEALGVRLTAGRAFTPDDAATAAPVAVVSESLAREYWRDEPVVGARIRFPGDPAGRWITIVGTVGDAKWQHLSETPQRALYLPLAQAAPDTMSLVIRTSGRDDQLPVAVRAAIQSLDSDTAVDRVAWLPDLVGRSAQTSRFLAVLFAGFAAVGLLLGGLGLFGVMSDGVTRRSREIAVRLAIGAEPAAIVRLVIRQSLALAVVGLAAGMLASLAGGRLIGNLLFGVSPADGITLSTVPVAVLAVVLASCVAPARRAIRIRPTDALKG